MIGVIGNQDDIIGFGLTGIQHLIEVPPNANQQDIQQAQQQLEQEDIQVLIIPAQYKQHLQTTELMIIEIPQENNDTAQEIEALTKELLGVQL